tara:strand:+ start:1104 stop:2135 length:1032 start_codon:yes stop_codon:yes gene_type:complete
MKVLISSDGIHAHFYQRKAWLNAFSACGIQAGFWDCKNVTPFDVFDSFEPDVFLGQSYNLTPGLLKCIYERPHLKIGLRAGDWGSYQYTPEDRVLYCSQQEVDILAKLKEQTGQPNFVHIHYPQDAVNQTHNKFREIGIDPISLMMCADTSDYSGAVVEDELKCDIGFVGGFWPYKGQVIEPYLFPLLHPVGKYKAKIFGNQPWNVNQFCGLISDERVKNLFVSAKICPNLSEPHAQRHGFDVNERIFKILYAGGFCISDNVKGYGIFGDGIVIANNPKDFADQVEHYCHNEDERIEIAKRGHRIVAENHTGFHRVAQILSQLGYEDLSNKIVNTYKENIHAR